MQSNAQLLFRGVGWAALTPLLTVAAPAVARAQGATVVVPIGGETTFSSSEQGGLLYVYLGVVTTWVASLVGAALLCFLVYYGFVLMFSGISEEKSKQAKEGLTATVGGIVLFLASGLILYTLNPVFFCGFGTSACTGVVLGEPGEWTPPAPPSGAPPSGAPPSSIAPSTSCSPEERAKCQVPESTRQQASTLFGAGWITLSSNTNLSGSAPTQNVADVQAGRCPVVQYGPASGCGNRNTSTCETRIESVLKPMVGRIPVLFGKIASLKGASATHTATNSRTGARMTRTGTISTIRISSLFGDKHDCPEHRQFRAVDITHVNGVHVDQLRRTNEGVMDLCTYAKAIVATGATRVIGPVALADVNCTSSVIRYGGHENHFHVTWNTGGGSAMFGAMGAGEEEYFVE